MGKDHFKRVYFALWALYVAQSIPMSFFTSAVPAIMRQQDFSLEAIGILQLVKLPWILKVLWAPMVDKKAPTLASLSKVIIYSEVFYACVILFIGFFSLETDFFLIAVLIIIAIIASATQDISTDSFSIRILDQNHHCIGAGMQSMGGFTGSLVGGGILLMVYNALEWRSLSFCMAVFVLISLIPLFLLRKEVVENTQDNVTKERIQFKDIGLYFNQKKIGEHIIFLVLYTSSIMLVLAMLRPYLVDLGQSIHQIGIVMGIIGTFVAALMSLFAGILIRKYGKKKNLMISSLLILIAILFVFTISVLENIPIGIVYLSISLIWCAHGFATVMMYSIAMGKIREGRAGMDFTLQTVLIQLSGLALSVLGGIIAGPTSYPFLFGIGVILAVVSYIYNMTVYKKTIQ